MKTKLITIGFVCIMALFLIATFIYVSKNDVSISGNITGINNTVSDTVCTDSKERILWDEGVTVGMMAVNVTTGESGQITAISGSTFTISATNFTEGWNKGDSFMILAGEYGYDVVISRENDKQFYNNRRS